MALGRKLRLPLRSLPDAGGTTIAIVPGSDVLWAEARSRDGQWLRVTFGEEEAQAWAASEDLTLLGEPDSLPVAAAEPLAGATPLAQADSGSPVGRVVTSKLNVRGGPGLDQPVLGQLTAEETVTVVGRSEQGDWLAITWGAGSAWVAAAYVEVPGAEEDLPVLAADITRASLPAPVLPGKVVFQTRNGGDIYIVNGDGSGLRRLAQGFDPALSPAGTQVAYTRWGSPHGVFVLDLDSGREQRVASANQPRGPTWSPDGSRLAFSHLTGSSICLATPFGCIDEGTIREYLGGEECIDTPVGRFCIDDFERRTLDETSLAQVTLEDGSWLDLASAPAAQSPHYHPLWDEILYRARQGLQITTAAGEMRALASEPGMGSPAWSPDGKRIAVQMHVHDHTDLFLLDAAGTVLQRLTAPAFGGRAANNVAPAWSPDGRYIVFLSDRDGDGEWRLYRMNGDGSQQVAFLPDALGDLTLTYEFAAERMASWGP
jgi:uncharacterized protein YraI